MYQKKCKVLSIDPEPPISKLIKVTLKGTAIVDGCDKFCIAEKILLNRFREQKYNIIILELFEKKSTDGLMFIKKIRDKDISVPIVVVSICSQTVYREKSLEYGANAYFTKPFDPEELEKKIKELHLNYIKSKK